jgi:segregation and condensation protein B
LPKPYLTFDNDYQSAYILLICFSSYLFAMETLIQYLEALLFCAHEPIMASDMQQCVSDFLEIDVPLKDITEALGELVQKYQSEQFSFQIYQKAKGYQFLTKPVYQPILASYLKQTSKKQLSRAALEALAIIAYRQPITRGDVELIRGVNSDYAVQKLLDKGLIDILGKADTPGRPILYGTSGKFMGYFGLNTLEDLPQPKDFAVPDE